MLSDMISNLASQIPGVTIGEINVPSVAMNNQGYSDGGAVKDVLDRLAKDYGFTVCIDNGIFYAVTDGKGRAGAIPVISYKNGFLKRVEPILVSFLQMNSGVMIQSLIDPRVNIGGLVQVESEINPQLNKTYQVHNYNATGDTHGNEWALRLESLFTGDQLPKM